MCLVASGSCGPGTLGGLPGPDRSQEKSNVGGFLYPPRYGPVVLHLFIQQHLFPHVKTGQSIIYHQHHIDIGYRNAALPAKLMGQFGGTAMPVSISKDHVEILCLESCLFQELLHHRRHFVAIDRSNHTDGICCKGHVSCRITCGMLMGLPSSCFATYRLLPVPVK